MRQDKAQQFMRQALFVAQNFSKDNSTKVGALVLDPTDYSIITQGYNGMPRGADESIAERWERPTKYLYFEHGERNAIYNLARKYLADSTCITSEVPSMDCMRGIISCGTTRLIMPAPDHDQPADDVRAMRMRACALFEECGGQLTCLPNSPAVAQYGEQYLDRAVAEVLLKAATSWPRKEMTMFLQGKRFVCEGRTTNELTDNLTETSVRNAIYNCVRPHTHGKVGLVTATTCVDCAKCWAACGLSQAIYLDPPPELKSRWQASFDAALAVLHAQGVSTLVFQEHEVLRSALAT
ncbi:hypothetical protein [Comamonas thiooxydans]|uniref:hypothetical protein n=1 Tax=Comamonas thiooxydans TaxID=363952 RepID=UPI000B41C045|nr:hypothetical protein [Comamonas thiooxydans]